jgi:NADPH:quinone reductase-like Zn-dependent oxidoreductase
MLTQFAVQAGLTVIGLVGGAAKQAFAAQFGAQHLIDTAATRTGRTPCAGSRAGAGQN